MIARRLASLGLGFAGALALRWGARSAPPAAPADGPAPVRVARPGPSAPPDPDAAAVEPAALEARIAQLDGALLAVTGRPQPWPEAVGSAFREPAIRAIVADLVAESEIGVVDLDCTEYPCVLTGRLPEGVPLWQLQHDLRGRGPEVRLGPTVPERFVASFADPQRPVDDLRTPYRLAEAAYAP